MLEEEKEDIFARFMLYNICERLAYAFYVLELRVHSTVNGFGRKHPSAHKGA
jgi:hypothetical protein